MTVTLTAQLLSTLALLMLGFWTHRKNRREISKLTSELGACRSALHEFMQETEATFAVFSRMVHKTESSNETRTTLPARNRVSPDHCVAKAQAVGVVAKPTSAAVPARVSKKAQVLKLAEKGMAAAEIASQLTIPQGEIDLILNLSGRLVRC